jgi:hypothetical protein
MKNSLLLLLSCLLFSACAKKTFVADSKTLFHQLNNTTDSSTNKTSSIADKTITIINRSIDTNIIVTGEALNGYLMLSKLSGKDTSAHFENDDLNLILSVDKTGKATATAIPKSKTINAKAFEQIVVYNDVVKNEETSTHAKSELAIKTSLTAKHTEKKITGNVSFSFSLIVILLLVSIFVWIGRKLLSLGGIFGNS